MTEEEKIAKAKNTLKNHQYTLIADGDGGEIWKCSKPNTNVYAFNIAIMPMGISVVGDIGELTFNAYGRGVDFLAGDDIEYYIHSKLSESCKDTQFDKEYLEKLVADTTKEMFFESDKYYDIFTEDEIDEIQNDIENLDFSELGMYFSMKWCDTDIGAEDYDLLDGLNDFFGAVMNINNPMEAYRLLDNCGVVEFHDVSDYDFEKPSDGLMRKLYLINEAAKEIMKLKVSLTKD